MAPSDTLEIVRSLEPHERKIFRLIGERKIDDEIANIAKIRLPQARILVNDIIRKFTGPETQPNQMSRYLLTLKWDELARHYTVNDDGEIVARREDTIEVRADTKPPESNGSRAPVALSESPARMDATPESREMIVACAEKVTTLPNYLFRTFESMLAGGTTHEQATRIGLSDQVFYTYVSQLMSHLKLLHVPRPQRVTVLKDVHEEWKKQGGVYSGSSKRHKKALETPKNVVRPQSDPIRKEAVNGAGSHAAQHPTVTPRTAVPKTEACAPDREAPPAALSMRIEETSMFSGLPVTVRLNDPDAHRRAGELIAQGYVLHIVNEYLWPDGKHEVTALFFKRK